MDFTIFYQEQQKLLNRIDLKTKRYLYSLIDFNDRCIGILGQRGIGKTTLMLQYLKDNFKDSQKALYVSLDNPFFANISLYEFAIEFEQLGGEILFLDEIHKYNDWSNHIKSIYDGTRIKVVLSGSSVLKIKNSSADLSRRLIVYSMSNLSFLEYLRLQGIYDSTSYSLEEILKNHVKIASIITKDIKILKYFKDYLKFGCYPFINEGVELYRYKLINIINQILESDLPYVTKINYNNVDKLKKLLYIIAISVPFEPNISKLANAANLSRPTLIEYIYYLESAHIINTLSFKVRGYKKIEKPDKIYLHNSNIMSAVTFESNKGNERETFFINQIKNYYDNKSDFLKEYILLSKDGDFIVDNKYVIEIGGKNKTFRQIKNIINSYIASDDIEIGFGNKIPLYLFGFLY
ncbi:MAG: AAA family ATPase [Deltaproteobacteria bacterium]|jgi:predicted AAA+ superfamily ATPase|nr:AAA family ATPase [Deltaproteobacteria bacterium]